VRRLCRMRHERRYAESKIMPNRDSKMPSNLRESCRSCIVRPGPCGIIRCASQDMDEAQHSPSIVLASFLVLWRASSASPRSWRAKRFLESITNVTARYAWANLIEASSVFRSSAGARLCRITSPRNSSGRCHGASIRRNPGFGIATKIVGCQMVYAGPPRTPFYCIPNYVGCHSSILASSILQNPSEHFSLAYVRMTEPNIHKFLAPSRDRHCS
jgi:hypothetical protein